jgi:ribonuclease HI
VTYCKDKEIHLWCDGSSINHGEGQGCGGYGYILLYGNFEGLDLTQKYCDDKYTLSGYGSATNTNNQRMELQSVISGLKRITRYDIPITVFSDSAYIVECMNQGWYRGWRNNKWKNSKGKSVKNQDLWEELLNIIEDNFLMIKFVKIKGHNEVYYNELADRLAKKGLEEAKECLK